MSLELTDVTVTFPDGEGVRHVLDGLDLSVAAGEAVALTCSRNRAPAGQATAPLPLHQR